MTTIKGFPLDSVVTGIAQNGLPEYSNKFHSVDYRRVINSLVSDGVIANIGQSLRVRVKPGDSATGEIAHFQVQTGTAVLQGVFAHVDDNLDFTISAPFVSLDYSLATQNYFVGIKVNTTENKDTYESAEVIAISGSIKNGSSTAVDPAVGSNFLVLARVVAKTVKNSNGSYTYSYTLQDMRASNLCGWSTPFAEIDASAYYDGVQEAIAEVRHQTQVALEVSKNALDETTAGRLTQDIDALKIRSYFDPHPSLVGVNMYARDAAGDTKYRIIISNSSVACVDKNNALLWERYMSDEKNILAMHSTSMTSADNINTMASGPYGVWHFGDTVPTGAPSDSAYYNFLNLYRQQILANVHRIYIRAYNGTAWTSWRKIDTVAV